jgi:hypothetical protein
MAFSGSGGAVSDMSREEQDSNLLRQYWPWGFILLTTIGLVSIGIPEALEGPTLLYIGPGHGLSVANAAALIPLSTGILGLLAGAWHARKRLIQTGCHHPLAASVLAWQLGIGGLLVLVSGPSTTLVTWAAGTTLSVLALVEIGVLLTFRDIS